MLDLLWLIPGLPLLAFLILALGGRNLPGWCVGGIGAAAPGLSVLGVLAVWLTTGFAPVEDGGYTLLLWHWIDIAGFTPTISFYIDHLSMIMMSVVSFVGFLILLYSAEFMARDEGYSRFMAYMNLFVGSMLILVMAANLLFLYVGWEGVGMCSYLLIGFWYRDLANDSAARKAFIVTRIGDAAMALGMFLIVWQLGTLNIQALMRHATAQWPVGSGFAVAAAALILGGAVGKSAQIPLQTWLPDAMAGPTPVSALIHAATMVTAGVYLIARLHVLYALAPPVQLTVAVVGAVTLLVASFSALGQNDIKRVLAYSTISQIGYMFLALGVGAWAGAIFHLMTHAFFKALLFLAAGVVIQALGEEHDIFRMGGLRKRLKVAFWPFLIGSAALAALPLITAGYYSKDAILWDVWSSRIGAWWLWAMGLVGALLTALYIFRVVFIAFYGSPQGEIERRPRLRVVIPLWVLSFLAIVGGFVEIPKYLGDVELFTGFLHTTLPPFASSPEAPVALAWTAAAAGLVALVGIALAWLLFYRQPRAFMAAVLITRFWHAGCGFDWVYTRVLIWPYHALARIDRNDFVDSFYDGVMVVSRGLHRLLTATQTGRVRWYAAGIVAGTVAFVALAVWR